MHKSIVFAAFLCSLPLSCWGEAAQLKARATVDPLEQLESLGIQLLTGILATSSISSSSSTSSSTSTTAASTSASVTSSASASSSAAASSAPLSAASLTSAISAASTSAASSSTAAHNKKNRTLAIILGTVLGFSVLLLLAALLWCCLSKRRQGRYNKGEKVGASDDELEPWQAHSNGSSKYITRIESWHEPKNSRNSSRGPPRGSRSHTSILERDVPDVPARHHDVPMRQSDLSTRESLLPMHPQSNVPMRQHNNGPMHQRNLPMQQNNPPMQHADPPSRYGTPIGAVPVPVANQNPRVNSHYGMIQIGHDGSSIERENPFNDPQPSYAHRPERHSLEDGGRNSRYPGNMPYRPSQSTQSTQSLVDRVPTPLFGIGKVPGETHIPTSVKRKSVGSSGPAELSNSTSPPPGSGTNGPWVPPKIPTRRRESIPGSPLAHSFDFGFGDEEGPGARKDSGNSQSRERYSMPGGWRSQASIDAHQRF